MSKKNMADLVALGQIMPAAKLALQQAEELKRELEFELAAQTEESHRKTKIQSGIAPVKPIFKREQTED